METLALTSTCSHARIGLTTSKPTEFIDLTARIQALVADSGVDVGFVNIQTLHTTTAIVVNEGEPLLLGDFTALLERAAPRDRRYRHDDSDRAHGEHHRGRARQWPRPLPGAAASFVRVPEHQRRDADARHVATGVSRGAGRPTRPPCLDPDRRRRPAMKVKMIRKKFEPCWDFVIRAERAGMMLPVLETVLTECGKCGARATRTVVDRHDMLGASAEHGGRFGAQAGIGERRSPAPRQRGTRNRNAYPARPLHDDAADRRLRAARQGLRALNTN